MKIKRVNKNAKLPSRGTEGAAGYDLDAAQAAVVPARGKCLVKTGPAMALPPSCYGKIAPRSGLSLKHFIDTGAGVIDSDYRGEIGIILFNFGNEDFVVNMGDRIAQLIFEQIKTPEIKEVHSLEESGRGTQGYSSTGMSATKSESSQDIKAQFSGADQSSDAKQRKRETTNESVQRKSHLSQTRQIISARQTQKLAKNDDPVFLAIVRSTNEIPQKRGKRSPNRCAVRRSLKTCTH